MSCQQWLMLATGILQVSVRPSFGSNSNAARSSWLTFMTAGPAGLGGTSPHQQ